MNVRLFKIQQYGIYSFASFIFESLLHICILIELNIDVLFLVRTHRKNGIKYEAQNKEFQILNL